MLRLTWWRGLTRALAYDLLYNVACCESLAGQSADAIEHLRLVLEKSEGARPYLANDSDLDPLREDPGCQALLAD